MFCSIGPSTTAAAGRGGKTAGKTRFDRPPHVACGIAKKAGIASIPDGPAPPDCGFAPSFVAVRAPRSGRGPFNHRG
ncbi:hypothetical protein GCM10009075_31790 [Sphingomonas trueperi]